MEVLGEKNMEEVLHESTSEKEMQLLDKVQNRESGGEKNVQMLDAGELGMAEIECGFQLENWSLYAISVSLYPLKPLFPFEQTWWE